MDPNEQPEPTLPPAEQMRQKRLAMLNRTANNASPDSASSTSSTPQPKPAEIAKASPASSESSRRPTPTQSKQPHSSPSIQSGVKNQPEVTAQGQREEGIVNSSPNKRPLSDKCSLAPPAKKIQAREEPLEEWSDRTLCDIFRVTLDETRSRDSHNNPLMFLLNLREELQQGGEPLKLNAQNIDQAILEAASTIPSSKPLRQPGGQLPEKQAVLDEAKRLCVSNCIFAMTMPELFGREPNHSHDSLVPYLLRNAEVEDGICLDFFTEAVERMKDDETVAPIFTEAMVELSQRLAKKSMNDDYKTYVNVLVTYARYPALLEALAEHPRFLVEKTPGMTKEQQAVATETQTILGPFFRISPLQPEVTRTYFANPRQLDVPQIRSLQSTLQMMLKAHQSELISITNHFVRAGEKARGRTLDWFAFALNTNHKRRAMRVDPREVASDGFMVNTTAVLDQLCQPFLDATFSKVSKIDIDYLRRNPRVDVRDETKLNADQATSDAFYDQKADGTSNFVSEVFFLNLASHHYGIENINAKLKDMDRDIKYFQKMEKQISEEMTKMTGFHKIQAQVQYDKVVSVLEKTMALRHSIEGVLTDQSTQALSLQFMRYVTVWLLRIASRSDYVPGRQLQLPLPAEIPDQFSCLPEYALQVVVENFKFVLRFMPEIMVSAVGDETVALCIAFLRSSGYIKNPYLKSSLVTVLYAGTFSIGKRYPQGILGGLLIGSEFANEHLLHALMKFYIECEHSGVSVGFYDRFNVRYEIFQVMKSVWTTNSGYKERLRTESRVNRQFFIQFVNLLLNDATYLLDEALSKLATIHEYQKELQDPSMSAEDREKKQGDLEQAEGQCQSWMQLVNETMEMMKLFTETLTDAFTMPEIVSRLASMLNYNLDTIVGSKRGNLKVEDAKKYNFDAKTLLSAFVDIYLNLAQKSAFIDAVAADGRSYKPQNFHEASRILQTRSLKSPEELGRWDVLKEKVKEAKDVADKAELDLGEIPEEFEDQLMGILMTDPVILPSKNVVDRTTIVQQLLSNPLDPFTRQPMTIDDVVPDDALRARVDEWKAERVAAARKSRDGDQMDTTEG
ncbi:ubiquitin domain-containing protein 2 [Apiospora aurea]|uniref:peptidylprolyl isomerase n=1 Tax=Apiospora aurea TaxID=335848 RepID=A0ABR1Q9B7_9PEZI